MTLALASLSISGLSLLLFALKYLTTSLDREISQYLRSGTQKALKTSWRCLLVGLVTTLVVQASGVTLLSSMGFMVRGMITLEQSLLITLGALVGSSLKGWYGVSLPLFIGPCFLLTGSVGLLAAKTQKSRRRLGMMIAIGISFLGYQLIEIGLSPLIKTELFVDLLNFPVEIGMIPVLKGVLIGSLLTLVFQSSSAILLLIISFSNQGAISLPAAMSLLLGSSLASGVVPVLASFIESNVNVRRLALGSSLVKLFAVGFILTYFKTHVMLFEGASELFGLDNHKNIPVAAFFTWLNLMNALTWWLFLPILVRTLTRLVPEKSAREGTTPFTARIQRLLGSLPGKIPSEGLNKAQQVIRDLHWVSDSIFHLVERTVSNRKQSQILEEALRKCERSADVLESVRDIAWRSVNSRETLGESQGKLLALITLTSDLKNLESILHSCIQTLWQEGISSGHSSAQSQFLSKFSEIRDDLNESWERLYSFDLNENQKNTFSLDLSKKTNINIYLFEIGLRLRSMCNFMEGISPPVQPVTKFEPVNFLRVGCEQEPPALQ